MFIEPQGRPGNQAPGPAYERIAGPQGLHSFLRQIFYMYFPNHFVIKGDAKVFNPILSGSV